MSKSERRRKEYSRPRFLIKKRLNENLAETIGYDLSSNFPSGAVLNVLGRVYVMQNRVRGYVETELRHE